MCLGVCTLCVCACDVCTCVMWTLLAHCHQSVFHFQSVCVCLLDQSTDLVGTLPSVCVPFPRCVFECACSTIGFAGSLLLLFHFFLSVCMSERERGKKCVCVCVCVCAFVCVFACVDSEFGHC